MDSHPYHHYYFFALDSSFYQLPEPTQHVLKKLFHKLLSAQPDIFITPYYTLGFKADTTFMLWLRAPNPTAAQSLLRTIFASKIGKYLRLSYTFFGIVRESQYSGRTGKPEQVMQNFGDRLPYFVLYPFTKTADWYLLDMDNRRSIMGQHIKTGLAHPNIRQCLLYSYGIDDYEFLVSYETPTLEEFQDLVIEMRKTIGRKYTLVDTPIFTCIYKPLDAMMEWL